MKILLTALIIETAVLVTGLPALEPPELDWQPCECNGMTRGLSDGDIMKLNMYLSRDDCLKEAP